MFDDPKKELRRLQEELLAEEAQEEEQWYEEDLYDPEEDMDDDLADIRALLEDDTADDEELSHRNSGRSRTFSNGYRDYSQELLEEEDPSAFFAEDSGGYHKKPREKGIRGLVILAWWLIWLL